MRKKLFFDTEFTGLVKDTTLISIGLVKENGDAFYAECTDYDQSKIDDWLKENVISNLFLSNNFNERAKSANATCKKIRAIFNEDQIGPIQLLHGTKEDLKKDLLNWLDDGEDYEVWSDCLAYDWVLFNDIFGSAFDIPKNICYIPMDICTMFKLKGIDPDISREKFIGIEAEDSIKHNALYDALVIAECYYKLNELK